MISSMSNTETVKCPFIILCNGFDLKEVIKMTLNILFMTITITKRKISQEEAIHQEMVEKLYEAHKERQMTMYRIM